MPINAHLIITTNNVWDIHVMCGRTDIFVFLVSKYINSHEVHLNANVISRNAFVKTIHLGVPMLSSLGGRHFDYLARATFEHNKPILPQGRTLCWISFRSTSISRLEILVCVRHNYYRDSTQAQ